jgi:hypothetical protein
MNSVLRNQLEHWRKNAHARAEARYIAENRTPGKLDDPIQQVRQGTF